MDLRLNACPDMNEVEEDYRKRQYLNDALICGEPIPPPQKVWEFTETTNILGRKTLRPNGGSVNVEIPRIQGMKEYLGKYLLFTFNPSQPKIF